MQGQGNLQIGFVVLNGSKCSEVLLYGMSRGREGGIWRFLDDPATMREEEEEEDMNSGRRCYW